MIHRLIFLTLIQLSLLLSQTQIAVVDFEALGVSSNDARALTNRLMIEMHRTNKFKVLEREMLDKVIEEQKFQLSGCNADQCLVELGQIANVQQIVGGSISKVGEVFTITARLISVESGEVVESALYDYEGNIGALMKSGMSNVAHQLASIQTPIFASSGTDEVGGIVKPVAKKKNSKSFDSLGLEISSIGDGYLKNYKTPDWVESDIYIKSANVAPPDGGVVITSIDKNSEAYRKGMRVGHIILKMGPNVRELSTIDSPPSYYNAINEKNSGEVILLLVQRKTNDTFFVALQ
jgi:TolB-like protein